MSDVDGRNVWNVKIAIIQAGVPTITWNITAHSKSQWGVLYRFITVLNENYGFITRLRR